MEPFDDGTNFIVVERRRPLCELRDAGEAGTSGPQDRARAAYPPDVFERLQAVKRRYDPNNLFRGNLNIPPGKPAAV